MSIQKHEHELRKILSTARLATWMGRLSKRTITVTFEEEDEYFTKHFEFSNRKDYTNFNHLLRGIHYGCIIN